MLTFGTGPFPSEEVGSSMTLREAGVGDSGSDERGEEGHIAGG